MTSGATIEPTDPGELCLAVRESRRLLAVGGGTKPALSDAGRDGGDRVRISMARLRGIIDYNPGEFTFTALAGTPLAEIESVLAGNGQYLPWDPPLVEAGSTLGGMLAAGVNGPGAFRFGGLRDFVLGAAFVDGRGRLLSTGGRVVKNAAGFDVPRLLVGSAGTLGVVASACFKVFPAPEARAAFRVPVADPNEAVSVLGALAGSRFEIEALQYRPGEHEVTGWIVGAEAAMADRLDRMRRTGLALEPVEDSESLGRREECLALAWCGEPAASAVKVPVTPRRIPAIEERLQETGARRRYDLGGHLLWIEDGPMLDAALTELSLRGMSVNGRAEGGGPWRPRRRHDAVLERLRSAFDPDGRFPDPNEGSIRHAAAHPG